MIAADLFFKHLSDKFDFFTGVPDSLLKPLCAILTDRLSKNSHIIAANEGGAVSLAAGHFLATGKPAVVYMQNSGLGNALNPLVSLCDPLVYSIPVLLIIGWRGEPGVKDEPQHIKQGQITTSLLDIMSIPYRILPFSIEKAIDTLNEAHRYMKNKNAPFALIVKKDAFEPILVHFKKDKNDIIREAAIERIAQYAGNSFIVSSTGMISRELFEVRKKKQQSHSHDFLTVGSMGHSSQIALGIALAQKDKRVEVRRISCTKKFKKVGVLSHLHYRHIMPFI